MKININTNIATILLVIFITLKLCNIITWSWLWVLSPLWIPFLIAFWIFVITAIIDVLF